MIDAYPIAAVYAAERLTMAPLADGELMDRAVDGLVKVARARLRDRPGRSVAALVGPGNNGGDALYAAARLAMRGFDCAAVYLADAVHAGALRAALQAGVVMKPVRDDSPVDAASAVIERADVVLDGIVGIGGRPGLPEFAQPWVAAIPDDAYVIAVDLPSGQDPAGEVADALGVWADETVTFSLAKPVHLLPATEPACGLLTIIDIGIDPASAAADPVVRRLDPGDVAALWPVPKPSDDKYSRGVLGIVAGGENYSGAALLAVSAAVAAGAGMVRYVGTPTPAALVRSAVPEAVHGPGQVQAWVIGPGLDVAARHRGAKAQLDVAREVLAGDTPVVIDAGGLDLVNGKRSAPTLLTPHAGECARLLTRLRRPAPRREIARAEVTSRPVQHARELAGLTGATVLLKGSTTIVVSPGSDLTHAQASAPAWLATAGAGDVLSGLLGTLVAAGLDLSTAGALGALVHGLAANRANPGGPVRASGVAAAIPGTVAAVLRVG